jgi:hypothetical protein
MAEICFVLLMVIPVWIGIQLVVKNTKPPNDDGFGQMLKRLSKEEAEIPERARRAGEEAARRVDLRYPNSARSSREVA